MPIITAALTVTSSYTNIVAPVSCNRLTIRSRTGASDPDTGGYFIQDPTSGVDFYMNHGEAFDFPRAGNGQLLGKIKSANAGPFTFDIKAEK